MATKKKLSGPERQKLSRDVVIQAAIKLTDEIGIEALSMRKLAENLNVEAMSLYNHVKNKEDLLDAMVDEVVAQMYLPNCDGNWRQEIEQASLSAHTVLMKHHWASMLLVSRPAVGSAKLAHFNAIQGCFVDAGFSPQMADQVRHVIDGHLYGFTLQKLLYPTPEGDYATAASQFLPLLARDFYPHSYNLVETVAKGKYDGKHYFEFGLTLLLNGIQKMLEIEKAKPEVKKHALKKIKD
ncbi:TetR/AcrR family transcriptional regulator C-terminal domain-containing protein [Undibacterium sp. Di24W]|uniref:TetR/AcrR family transcriptional regulator C-terminal domain-containing protein n=1 Tax=Undibacterium sp. Di24W TaxID=3413033 RepID=UPI003BF2358F